MKSESEKAERDHLTSALFPERMCAYDRSFKWLLSPNITNVRGLWPRLIPALRKARVDRDQGWWIRDPRGMRRLGNFSSCELIYVNDDCRVLKVMRTRSRFIIPWVQSATGVLALTTTPTARATQAGNELLICVPEELEAQLQDELNHSSHTASRDAGRRQHQKRALGHFRLGKPGFSSDLVVTEGSGGRLDVLGIKDVDPTGLHLLCEQRLPLGAMVTITLASPRGSHGRRSLSIRGKVIRLGLHGFTIAFVEPATDVPAFLELVGMN